MPFISWATDAPAVSAHESCYLASRSDAPAFVRHNPTHTRECGMLFPSTPLLGRMPSPIRCCLAVLCVGAASLARPSEAMAQRSPTNIRLIGFKAGIATSNTRPADAPELPDGEAITGPTFGVFGRLPLGRNVAAQAEIVYLRQGVDSGRLHIRSTVLRLPVTLQLLILANKVGLRLYAGGTVDMPLSCSMDELVFDSGFGPTSTVTECPFSRAGGSLGFAGGALVDLALGGSVLTLDIRYDHGLSRLEGGGADIFFGRVEFPDLQGFRGFEFTVGLGIPVRGRR